MPPRTPANFSHPLVLVCVVAPLCHEIWSRRDDVMQSVTWGSEKSAATVQVVEFDYISQEDLRLLSGEDCRHFTGWYQVWQQLIAVTLILPLHLQTRWALPAVTEQQDQKLGDEADCVKSPSKRLRNIVQTNGFQLCEKQDKDFPLCYMFKVFILLLLFSLKRALVLVFSHAASLQCLDTCCRTVDFCLALKLWFR